MSVTFGNPDRPSTVTDFVARGGTIRYPNPFFDVAQTYMPTTVKHLFSFCKTYYLGNGLVNNVINRMAYYPVTKLRYGQKTKNKSTDDYVELFEEQLNLESFLIEVGVNVLVFGNAYMSVHYPIRKMLTCTACKHEMAADTVNYKFERFEFKLSPCPRCGSVAIATVRDMAIASSRKINLIRWDVMDVEVFFNQANGMSYYILSVPMTTAKAITEGNTLLINDTPQVFIDAVKRKEKILLNSQNVFHMRRPSLAGQDMGLGIPLVLPAMKDLYLMQVLKKSQEVIAHEHIVPLRILHPATSTNVDPIQTMDLTSWQSTARSELARWRQDQNYIPMLPMPIGFQYLGGQGKSLLLTNELKQLSESIVMSLNAPIEFAFGGSTYSGSSVTLRMLENQFLRHQSQLLKLVKFITSSICNVLRIEPPTVEFTSLRTADDIQRKSILMQLNQMNRVSARTLLEEFNLDPADEEKMIETELGARNRMEQKQFLQSAENQGKAQVIGARYQSNAQMEAMKSTSRLQGMPSTQAQAQAEQGGVQGSQPGGQPEGQEGPMVLSEKQIKSAVKELAGLQEGERAQALQQLGQKIDPQSLQMIIGILGQKPNDNMKPLPDQRPPRRHKALV